jgi:uncharacterized protein
MTTTTAALETSFVELIAAELGCRPQQVEAAASLLAEGATVPFIARYRKEVTGGLEDAQLELLAKRRSYFLELCERRDAILRSIDEQGKLNEQLEAAIRAATSKQELEDLYLPYKPKRRTRAQIAREKGLEPLAEALIANAGSSRQAAELAADFIDAELGVEDGEAALAGARDIVAEGLAEEASNRARLRQVLAREGVLEVRVLSGKEEEGAVFRDYFEHSEPARSIPSHRLLAMLRGEQEGVLVTTVNIDDERESATLAGSAGVPLDTPCGQQVEMAAADAYKRLLRPSITNEIRAELRERAEAEAIRVFRANLEALLMQSPLGLVPVMGLDPGYRTGCKLAVADSTGRVVATAVIYPVPPKSDEAAAARTITSLIKQHGVRAVAVGNGTASRETEAFARKVVHEAGIDGVIVAIVPETGASVYSASEVARDELPELDVSLRGAVSIARRLQDPLAELVKIEPRSLGVGQYQHDVDQRSLAGELDLAVEGVVNRVGVELNTASSSLLRRISGLTERTARAIVSHRDQHGVFSSRKALLEVSGLGPKTFQQAAGFLRIRDGSNPLDATAVHPERYPAVETMARHLGVSVSELVGSSQLVARLDMKQFADSSKGLGDYTLQDIRAELERPGRDPRPTFKVPELREDVVSIEDLEPGMTLEGRVSNVTNFGAFVDIGVKRDGLVHVSELSHTWTDNPRDVIKVGEIVKVKVLEVDHDRGRISLSKKALEPLPKESGRPPRGRHESRKPKQPAGGASVNDLMRRFGRDR